MDNKDYAAKKQPFNTIYNYELSKILSNCSESKGFIVFVGIIGDTTDKYGNQIINFQYIRDKFPYEDTKLAIQEFSNILQKDINGEL